MPHSRIHITFPLLDAEFSLFNFILNLKIALLLISISIFLFSAIFFKVIYKWNSGFPDSSGVKYLPANAGTVGLIPGSWRSPGAGMATHSSIHVWRIPQTEEPGRLQSMGSQKNQTQLSTHTINEILGKCTFLAELKNKNFCPIT